MGMVQCCTNAWLSSATKFTVVCLQVVAAAAFSRCASHLSVTLLLVDRS
jgi:hypothetical protein